MSPLCIPWQSDLSTGRGGEAGGGVQLCVQSAEGGSVLSAFSSRCFINPLMMLLAHVPSCGNEL